MMVDFLDTFKVFRWRGLLRDSIENGPIKLVGDAGHEAARSSHAATSLQSLRRRACEMVGNLGQVTVRF